MYVCLCRAVTDKDIKRAVDAGHCNPAAVREQTGAGTGCGRCWEHASALVQKLTEAREPRFYALST